MLIDTNGDGLYDGMDGNGDGVVDQAMDQLAAAGAVIDIDGDGNFAGGADGTIVDINNDGTADGVDTDGDGKSDISLANLRTVIEGGSISDTDAVADDADDCEITFSGSDTADSVTTNLDLPTSGANGTTISWTSDNTGAININGGTATVTRPDYGSGDKEVTLTAKITKNVVTDTKVIKVTVIKAPDSTAPYPGNSGTITISSVSVTSLTVNWTAATDNASAQANLQYLVYYSTGNNIDSAGNCEGNGTAVGSYTANITTRSVTGLTAGSSYYFNIVVRNEKGNKATYTTVSQATKTVVPSDYIVRYHFDGNGDDEKNSLDLSYSYGSPEYSTTSPKEGSAYLVLDGDDYLYTDSYQPSGTPFSVAVWIFLDPSSNNNYPTVFATNWYSAFTSISYYNYNNWNQINVGVDAKNAWIEMTKDTWHHVVMSYNGSSVVLYVDGAYQRATNGSTGNPASSPIYIGNNCDKTGDYYWDGFIDDLIMYDRALSADDVSDIYNSY